MGLFNTLALDHNQAFSACVCLDLVMTIRFLMSFCGMQCVLDKLHPYEAYTVPLHAGEVLGGVGGLPHV